MSRDATTIAQWIYDAHHLSMSKGWWDKPEDAYSERRIPETLMLVVSELAEALECWRDNGSPNHITFSASGKPEGFSIEIADTVLRLFDLCGALNVDLQHALEIKHAYNQTRSYRHGGKRA